MHAASTEPPLCSLEMENCGNPVAASLFFPSIIISLNFFFLNLFISIMLENFASAEDNENKPVEAQNIIIFMETWRKYDTDGTRSIPKTKVGALLKDLPPPMGMEEVHYHDMGM